jgi:uncharacterized protein (DUF1697 family)
VARYIAFLRGINVGGHTVKMDDLRRVFEDLDLAQVDTFITSGNVIFEADVGDAGPLAQRIEGNLRATLGYEVATFLRSDAEVARIADYQPFPDVEPRDGDTAYVAFLREAPSAATRRAVLALANDTDHLHLHQRELHWLIRGGLKDSTIGGPGLEKAFGGAPSTVRNVNTVRRLAAKYPPTGS